MRTLALFLLLLLPVFVQAQEDNDENKANIIDWRADRKLNWDDFQGRVPTITREAALSQCGFGYATNKVYRRQDLVVTVSARFYRRRSWSHPKKRSPRLLQHEQRHFDLCEVYARKLRQRLAAEHFRGADINKLDKIYQHLSDELAAMQQKYDEETIHGLDTEQQHEWNEKIAKELDELAAFSDK